MIAFPSLRFSQATQARPPAPTMPPFEAERVRRIRTALAAVNVLSRAGRHVQGPRVTVYRFLVPAAQMEKAVRRTAAIEAALDCDGVALRQQGRWLVVEVPRHDPRAVLLEAAGPVLGVAAAGGPVTVQLGGSTPHAVIGAQTGGGKTELLRTWALLESRQPQTRLVLLDMEGSSWAPFAGSGHLVATDVREVEAALAWAVDRLSSPGDSWRVVVMVDEAQMLSPTAQGLMREVAERGRKHAVHLVVATQYIRQDVLDRRLTSNAPIRIAGRLHDATASKQVLGIAGAERLLGRGDMLLVVGGAPPVRFQACLPGGEVWGRIGRVEPLELGTLELSTADNPVVDDMLAWAAETGASARAIRLRYGIGQDKARKVRDKAAGMTDRPPTVIRPDFAARVLGRSVSQGAR